MIASDIRLYLLYLQPAARPGMSTQYQSPARTTEWFWLCLPESLVKESLVVLDTARNEQPLVDVVKMVRRKRPVIFGIVYLELEVRRHI
jgi:hypothetical protein